MARILNREGMLLCLVGPAGSGKTTFGTSLLESYPDNFTLSISVTSRPMRKKEVDGDSYHFVSREKFEELKDSKEFFEWEETHGNYYGTLQSTVDNAVNSGIDLLLDIDIRGALRFKKHYPNNTVIVFIFPPSIDVLVDRLRKRSSSSEDEIKVRLETARREYDTALELRKEKGGIDYYLINDDFTEAFSQLRDIWNAETLRFSRTALPEIEAMCKIK